MDELITIPNYYIVEKLGEGPQSVAYKGFHKETPHRPLVIKVLKAASISEDQKRHFRQKIEHLKVLNDIRLITPLSFEVRKNVQFFTKDYFQGITLDKWSGKQKRINLNDFFTVACRIAEALNKAHETGIIHGGIKPHNILIQPESLDIRLIDFTTSIDVSDISHFIYDRGFVEDSLAYTSPEQTGRINYRVDFSSDLYSLGITCYKLLTGQLPFFSTDPLELIHSHLAEEALPVNELNPVIPSIVGKIIAKQMLKQPEKRYQSATGLLADLMRCRDEYAARGAISEFPLGIYDRTHRVAFVSKMVGRDMEAEIILEEYNKAAQGFFKSLFISGLPGIGKTRLIQALQKPIVEHRGYFTSGKFDVYQKNIPYSSIIHALRNLVRTFLTESNERVVFWKQKIIKAVGNNGTVVIDVIPELEILIGPQAEAKPLPPVESGNRFHDVFGRFLTCLAAEEHPLVLFIDELQWCDIASFDFLANIFDNYKEHRYLFLIGAYRHNEVDSSHPLTKLLQGVKKDARPMKEVRLEPLKPEHCHDMVSYILGLPLSQVKVLAGFIAELTEGNPLFVSEMLSYLYNENLLILADNKQWQWDMDRIARSDMPATVVSLFTTKIKKLPDDTFELLEYCACMGNRFIPDEIALTREITLLKTFEKLKPALSQGLLIESKDQLQFVHDRVQEATLTLIKPERERQIHWQIGEHLLFAVPKGSDLEKLDNLFTIVSHLHLGKESILDRNVAYRLSDISYHAGNKALGSLATEAANEYFRQSLEVLPDDCWEVQYDRTFKIYRKLAKTELMCGKYENSEKLLNQLLERAKTDLDKAEALAEQTTSLSSIGNFIKAIETANRGLAFFGKSIPDDPEIAEQKREQLMNEIDSQYAVNIWDAILDMPFTKERKSKIELAFYSELIPDLYMSGLVPQLYLSAVQSTRHCLEGGMDESAIYSFSIMGLYLAEQEEFEQAFRYEDMARNLSAMYPNTFGATRGMNGVVWCNMHSRSHPEEVVNYCLKAIQCGRSCGDLYNAGLSYGPLMWNLQVQGADLLAVEEYADECLQFSQKYHLSFSVALAEAMQAGWIEPMKKDYTPIPMDEKIKKWDRDNHIAAAGIYYVHMALTSYYFGEYENAEEYLFKARQYMRGLTDNVLKRQWHAFQVLNALRLYERKKVYESKEKLLSYIQPLIKKIETWAQFGPTLKPYLAFIHAELERVTGDFRKARSLYFDAIAVAHEQRFTLLEAHLNECRAELLKNAGIGTERVYFAEAIRLYKSCHAERKEIFLMEKYPEYFEEEVPAYMPEEVDLVSYTLPCLDVDYLMKSSFAISAEIDPDVLLKRIMNVILEASGAQHGYLLVEEGGSLIVHAESHITEKGVVRTVKYNFEDAVDICKAIIRYVHRTKEMLALNNASKEGEFKDNPEVQTMRLRSVLCLPLIKQSSIIGILYLENRLSDEVFTSEKARMTELLSSQAAISLENARLLDQMKKTEEQIKESLSEKEVLLREIHHRVKNNLQIISSLFRLQSAYIRDEHDMEIFKESQSRVRSMALIHERLYQSKDLAKIDFAEYTNKLVTHLLSLYAIHPETITLDISVDDVFLSVDIAVPCGLIINELVSNCLKHAFPESTKGKIRVELRMAEDLPVQNEQSSNMVTLIVSDNGAGFPKNLDFRSTETLGLELVTTLVKQLNGTIELNRSRGTEFKISFPSLRLKAKL
ncbi:MAG: AAA family ATPase [Deltaproteobacteria bacterium]|jgi:predicted ATPase/two-component sensor histidine kinase/tRNA A-37 threonylcarbamoyl transferase component Bud32|nr:AAA family ATPase [Deltaproteobacteria bacterium]